MKKLSLLLPFVALLSLTGCGQNSGGETTSTTVKISLMNSTNENPGWLAMIDKANSLLSNDKKNIVIEPEIIKTDSWDEYYTKVSSNMAGRIGGTIGRIAESHIPLMIEKNQLQDLTPIASDLLSSGKYNESAFQGTGYKDGKYYGLPSGSQHMLLYYNKDVFDQYNTAHPSDKIAYPSGDWSKASSFEEIADAAKKLSSGDGASRRFGLSAGPYLAYAGMYSVNSGGENIFDKNGNCVIKSQSFYDVYEWFDKMLKTDKSMPSTSDTATSSAIDRFLGGNIAMIIDGVWQLHDMVKYTSFNVGVAAIPVKNTSFVSHTTTFTDEFFAVRTSKSPEQDKIALRYLQRAESISALAEKQVGGFPIYKDEVSTYTASLSSSKLKDYVGVITGGLSTAVSVPYSTYYNIVDQRINQKMAPWINGEMSSHDFVDYMDEMMQKGMRGEL